MYAFFIVTNIGQCHRNPRLLPTPFQTRWWLDIPEGNPRWVVCQTKMDKGVQKTILDMCAFFIVNNIGLCHRNPRLLPLYFHTGLCVDIPKGNPRWVVCQRKMDKGGTEDDFWNVCFFHSNQYKSMSRESKTFTQTSSILDDV